MAKPTIAFREPKNMELKPGTYFWCACGRSKTQPMCDGSHSGTDFQPLCFEITEAKPVWLCQCKHTKNPPYCDGSHKDCGE